MIHVAIVDRLQRYVLHVKNGAPPVYENIRRKEADVSITCPKKARLAQRMKQTPVSGIVPFNTIKP